MRLAIVVGFMLVFLAGCSYKSALDLINLYGCAACKPDECKLCVGDVCEPCGEAYLCCKEFVPEKDRWIFDCKYDPLLD